jgi:Fur family iron response transcriptional regulator
MTEFMDVQQLTDAIEAKLRRAGLRPTRQRLDLARLLFREGDRHVTAEMLHAEAASRDISVSLATVYNTLHQFTECGLLRGGHRGSKACSHKHLRPSALLFRSDGTDRPQRRGTGVRDRAEVPEDGISRVDVLIRLVEKPSASNGRVAITVIAATDLRSA